MEQFIGDVSNAPKKYFVIKYGDTEPNNAVHEAFIHFAWAETDGSYLQALKKLLENYSDDYRFELLHSSLEELRGSVVELAKKAEEPKPKKTEVKVF